jgi:uncharacterized SAM-binding protein YcdF (DUF218 family)
MTRFATVDAEKPAARSWLSAAVVLLLVGIVVTGWLAKAPLLRGVTSAWIVSDQITHADAIVLLGGNFHVRPQAAAELYRRGVADRILVSRTVDELWAPASGVPTDFDLNRAALLKLGVPATAIQSFGTASANTRDEALAIKSWIARNGAANIVIPSEIFSARRVQWIFQRELADISVAIEVGAFDPPEYSWDDWWTTENGVFAFQSELLKYVYYRLRY